MSPEARAEAVGLVDEIVEEYVRLLPSHATRSAAQWRLARLRELLQTPPPLTAPPVFPRLTLTQGDDPVCR